MYLNFYLHVTLTNFIPTLHKIHEIQENLHDLSVENECLWFYFS